MAGTEHASDVTASSPGEVRREVPFCTGELVVAAVILARPSALEADEAAGTHGTGY